MVLDNSPRQLAHDKEVAERDNLEITLLLGDMRDLHMLEDESFDRVEHPVSNTFIPDYARYGVKRSACCGPAG